MRSISVVITDDGPHGPHLRDIAAQWTASGLLTESIWVMPSGVTEVDRRPATVRASLLTEEGLVEHDDLFTLIGVRRLDLVRVVLVHTLAGDAPGDLELSRIGRQVAGLIGRVLPRDEINQPPEGKTDLIRINVLIPESGLHRAPPALLQPEWEVNALAAPEDRPDLDRASVYVRASVNLHAHAVAAVAAIGGLWPGSPEGAFDGWTVDSSSGSSDLVVFRTSSRALLGDDVASDLAGAAMDLVQRPDGTGAAEHLGWAALCESPAEVTESALRELLRHGDWARDELSAMPPLKSEMGLRAAFSDLLRFQLQLVPAAGRMLRKVTTRIVETAATSVTAGTQGDFVVRLEPRHPDEVLESARSRLQQQSKRLQAHQLKHEAGKVEPPSPQTWAELRALCFGLVDGSPLPGSYITPERAGIRELLHPSWLVPHPSDTFTDASGHSVRVVDVAAVSELAASSDGAVAEEAEPAADVNHTELDRLNTWVSERADTLVWRLADLLSQRRHKAITTGEAALHRATDTATPAVEQLRKARRTLLTCWAVIAVLCIAALAATGLAYLQEDLTWAAVTKWGPRLLGAAVIIELFGGFVYYRALRRFEWDVTSLMASRQQAAETYVVAQRESRRLRLLYEGLLDWSEVIGWLVHEPWVAREHAGWIGKLEVDDLPASVALATPADPTGALTPSLVRQAVGKLCVRGWSTKLFDDALNHMAAQTHTPQQDSGHIPADMDSGVARTGPRRSLLEAVASPELRMCLARDAEARIHKRVSDRSVTLPVRSVQRIGKYASADALSDTEFFAGALGPQTPFIEDCWTDEACVNRIHLVDKAVAWLPASRGMVNQKVEIRLTAGDCAIRVDYSARCQPSDIALFDMSLQVAEKTRKREFDDLDW